MSVAGSSIRLFDYRQQYAALREEILAAVDGVLSSGTLILGPRVEAFEANFARFLGVPGTSVGVGNGTDAVAIALRALSIGPGDKVLTVANTAIPTVAAIRMAGATPVLCDIDPDTLLIDLNDAEMRVTPQTKAILPVHLFGNAVDMHAVQDFAARNFLRVVEDCAQSCGTIFAGQATGTFGDAGCFSFYPTKNLGAYGDGGLCFSTDRHTAESMRQIRMYGCGKTYYSEREGVNSRLDELQAAILDVKLRYLAASIERRRAIAALYDHLLDPAVARPRTTLGAVHSYHLYVIQTPERDTLVERFKADGIGFGIHYPTPIHRMRGYEFLGLGEGTLPVTETAAGRVVSLPCYPELDDEAIARVALVVNEVHA